MNKKLLYGIPIAVLLMAVAVFAAVSYYHQVNVDLTVSEARSSTDVPFSLSCMSGETVEHNLTVHNNANVALNTELTWTETENNESVLYSNNLPQTITLAPTSDTVFTVSMVCSPVTPAGVVIGTVNMNKAM